MKIYSLTGKSIMITGGAGFIGSHLVDRLIEEHPANIVVLDNFFLGSELNLKEAINKFPNLKIYHQDITVYEKVKEIVCKEHVQIIFNLAIIPLITSLEDPYWTYTNNVLMTMCLCELARHKFFNTLIHFSSSEVYGNCEYLPINENHPLAPTTPYAASKASSDLLILSYINTFNINAAIIRPFNNFGPRQNINGYAGIIPLTIKRLLNNDALIIYGDGKQSRDFIYVTDTVNAAVGIFKCQKTRGKVVNVGSGREITIENILKLLITFSSKTRKINYYKARVADVRRQIADISLANRLINFSTSVNFNRGLKQTIKWYEHMYKASP